MRTNPPWTEKEELEFIEKWWSVDREYFINEAMKHNLGIVFEAIQKVSYKHDLEDIFQKGVSELVAALRKYNPEKGVKISTWVTNPVRWAIMKHQNPYNHQGSIADEIQALNHRYGTKLSVVSTDDRVNTGDASSESETVGNMISSENVCSRYFNLKGLSKWESEQRELDYRNVVEEIFEFMPSILTEKEQYVVRRTFDGKNMTEISSELKLSRMRVSQITANAFAKIRNCKISRKLKELFR